MSEPVYSSLWFCVECGEGVQGGEMDHAVFQEHLKTVHGLQPLGLKGTKCLSMHLRGSGFSVISYDWWISGKQFRQTITRGKERRPAAPAEPPAAGPINPPKQRQLEL